MTLSYAFNVLTGCAMRTGRFVAYNGTLASVHTRSTVGLTARLSRSISNRHSMRAPLTRLLRVAPVGALSCAGMPTTLVFGEDK